MKLTIGMIVKNEEKWLDKCLSAIKPILDNVDSELIITDTGSVDKTVEIAKKYTDRILHFDWINDFSAARNYGLEKANGEWFMFLDADEIFQSCEEIISFFNSGEYKYYNSASFIIRNWGKINNKNKYNDMYAPRIVKIFPDTRFINKIHEKYNFFSRPGKVLYDVADHYGYLYETEEEKKNKFDRNRIVLLHRFDEEKNSNPFIYIQLYDLYNSINDSETALQYVDEGIKIALKNNSNVAVPLYFYKIYNLHEQGKHEIVIRYSHEYFLVEAPIRIPPMYTDGEIYVLLGDSQYQSGNYIDAIEAFESYFEIMELIENDKIDSPDKFMLPRCYCDKRIYLIIVNEYIRSCIKTKEFNRASNNLCLLPLYKYSENQDALDELILLETELIKQVGVGFLDKFGQQLPDEARIKLNLSTKTIKPIIDISSEMMLLAEKLKKNIKNMIAAKDYVKAEKYLKEYSAINPNDPEIYELINLIK